ncbi:bifunctional helix-turn-helix transcriptional regulator/GNAT family N-acetyltransferase [Streptosporangium sp. NPDC006930]|uniref:bifunctional helix-turn-helix transcriptional regulator/GNAT family N-acetyltransferase n=1 Tax=unclassified Streptosporangium TaxID=2632669 RepID=UPI00343C34A0
MERHVADVRAFNRFYTGHIGLLHQGILDSSYSLTEVRVLFELDRAGRMEASELRRLLDLDAGYLSRMLGRFEGEGLVVRERSAVDARRQVVELTGEGRARFAGFDERAAAEVHELLAGLTEEDRGRLVASMTTIEEILGRAPKPDRPYVIRPPRPGDLGWVVYRHGTLYSQEQGWGMDFEALVARVVADYVNDHDPRREAGWIAEVDGERAGCVFCVRRDDETAQLRMLLVEPSARGMGIGTHLVDECMRFARAAGYRRMMLWTRDVLLGARRIYRAAGFELVEKERSQGDQDGKDGKNFVEEIWARDL